MVDKTIRLTYIQMENCKEGIDIFLKVLDFINCNLELENKQELQSLDADESSI